LKTNLPYCGFAAGDLSIRILHIDVRKQPLIIPDDISVKAMRRKIV